MQIAIDKNQLEESVKEFIDVASPLNLPKILVEFSVVAQVGKLFCECVYALEEDNPLGSSYQMIFERLDGCANSHFTFSRDTIKACDRVGVLMLVECNK